MFCLILFKGTELTLCSITTNDCRHLIIDAGHIAIESELADKKAIQEINAKRKQQYTDEDYKQLESMMYDRLTVRLQAAQVRIYAPRNGILLTFVHSSLSGTTYNRVAKH